MTKKKQSGIFRLSSGLALAGELILDGISSQVRVHSDEHFRMNTQERWMQGELTDLKQVTLVACQMPPEPGYSSGPSGTRYHARIYPHFILTGDYAINPDDANIKQIRFFVHDHIVLSTDHDAYGGLWDFSKEQMKAGISKIDFESGLLLYFTGKREIATAKTPLGAVTIEHAPKHKFRHGFGGVLKDRIAASIVFDEPLPVLEAILRSETIARFLSIIIGRRQRIDKSLIRTAEAENFLTVFRRVPMFDEHSGQKPGSFDLLIDIAKDPAQFSSVLEKWLQDESSMSPSRANLFRSLSLFTKSASDRLVTAANMFDLLPDNRLPVLNEISQAVVAARETALSAFRPLGPSPERDSILSALGRIGHHSLKRKIRHQVHKIRSVTPDIFFNLETVTDHAVTCRNFYVHGSPPSFNYESNPWAVRFMTEALEFVFIAADLLEAGWGMHRWLLKGHSVSNQMSSFAVNYGQQWEHFEKLISKPAIPSPDSANEGNN